MAELLARRGAVVLDADAIVHEVTAPGGAAHAAVVDRFGPAVVGPDGSLDRRALADLVFDDAAARRDLEALVHPVVMEVLEQRLADHAGTDRVVVAVVPLLVEVGWDGADRVVVVDCPEEVAVRRLVEARGMDEPDARRRIAAQVSRQSRLARADHVITNDGTLDSLRDQVDALWPTLVTGSSGTGRGASRGGPRPGRRGR